jgi:hypothetical protein
LLELFQPGLSLRNLFLDTWPETQRLIERKAVVLAM